MGAASAGHEPPGSSGQPVLKRAIGPGLLLLFIVGDILGTGIYALTGKVAQQIGGIAWLPFMCAFAVALLTACSYLELVTKYPHAGGAAVYTQRAFGVRLLSMLITLLVMASGLTSAASASKAFAANLGIAAAWNLTSDSAGFLLIALSFIGALMVVNLRGIKEGVGLNVAFTLIELAGLLIVVAVGIVVFVQGTGDPARLTEIRIESGAGVFSAVTAATALAFFAMVGFEDSVNMAEEARDPVRIFPRVMLLGLTLTAVIYVLVALAAVVVVDPAALGEGEAPLLKVVMTGAPSFPIALFAVISSCAVANSALINLLMASRLLYGMAREGVIPGILGRVGARRTPWVAVLFTTGLCAVLVVLADLRALGGTTSLLLLVVFTTCNIAVLVLRNDRVEQKHFKAPTVVPVLGALSCAFLASPLSGRNTDDYVIAGWLLAAGVVLWLIDRAVAKFVARRRRAGAP